MQYFQIIWGGGIAILFMNLLVPNSAQKFPVSLPYSTKLSFFL